MQVSVGLAHGKKIKRTAYSQNKDGLVTKATKIKGEKKHDSK